MSDQQQPAEVQEAEASPIVLHFGPFFITSAAVAIVAIICLTYLAAHSPESLPAVLEFLHGGGRTK